MNRILALVALLIAFNAQAQEKIINGVNKKNFTGFYKAGEMGETLYTSFFSEQKIENKNFFITRVNSISLEEEGQVGLELPTSYKLETSSYNGMAYTLVFKDSKSNERILMLVGHDGNVSAKKKISNSGEIKLVNVMIENVFVTMSIKKNGSYTIRSYNAKLEENWKKSYNPPSGTTWNIVSAKSMMESMQVVRKRSGQKGKYLFQVHILNLEKGENVAVKDIKTENVTPYLTFLYNKEGMIYVGGYYYGDGVYSKSPTGVFFANLTEEGNLEQSITVPYSQIIEGVKRELGDKLMDKNTGIVFTGGAVSHDPVGYVLVGHVYKRTNNTSGGGAFTSKDIVAIRLDEEMNYSGAKVFKAADKNAVIKGNIATVNDLDLATWLNSYSFFPLKYIDQAAGPSRVVRTKLRDNGKRMICYEDVGGGEMMIPDVCVPITRKPVKANSTFVYKGQQPVESSGLFYSEMNIESVTTYELSDEMLMLWNVSIPLNEPVLRDGDRPEDDVPPPPRGKL